MQPLAATTPSAATPSGASKLLQKVTSAGQSKEELEEVEATGDGWEEDDWGDLDVSISF